MQKRQFKNNVPTPNMEVSDAYVNTIDGKGNGWLTCDLTGYIKPKYKGGIIIESATPQQIAAHQQQQQMDAIKGYIDKWKADGTIYHDDMRLKITASLVGKPDAMVIMAEINKVIYPLLSKIKSGDWALAILDYQDNDNNPTIPEVITLFNEIGQKAIEYYTNEYPH